MSRDRIYCGSGVQAHRLKQVLTLIFPPKAVQCPPSAQRSRHMLSRSCIAPLQRAPASPSSSSGTHGATPHHGVSKDSDMQILRQACACCNKEETVRHRNLALLRNRFREQAHEKVSKYFVLIREPGKISCEHALGLDYMGQGGRSRSGRKLETGSSEAQAWGRAGCGKTRGYGSSSKAVPSQKEILKE